jgi:hypothetical protein
MRYLIALLLLTGSAYGQTTLTLTRDGKQVYATALLSPDPVEAGNQARAQFALWGNTIKQTDTLLCTGVVDFGKHYHVKLPECNYVGPARWLTHCMIDATTVDGIPTKPSGTPGICLGRYAHFENFSFGGDCWNRAEDGGLLGWSGANDYDAEVTFVNCDIDASQGMDWGACYSWENANRKVTIKGGTLRFCRFGVSMSASGAKANQQVILDGVKLIGDANGSTSYGESSGGDVNTGGVLTAVLNRAGSVVMRDCTVEATGLTKPYNSKWGCPRIAALATDQYYSTAGATTFTVERCKSSITPGISQAWYDVDVRRGKLSVVEDAAAIEAATKAGEKLVIEARGGSNDDGSLKTWGAQ